MIEEEKARILVYGYDADIASFTGTVSKDKIHNHADNLVAELYANRRKREATERPIIFIAHSLGGLLVKRALIYSSEIRGHYTQHLRSIFISTFGILFLGTPHRGFDYAKRDSSLRWICDTVLRTTVIDTMPPLINPFATNSETLQNIDRQFIQLANRFHVYFFHEGKPTNFKGVPRYIVDEESVSPIIQDVERACIQQDHSHMCKFENDSAPGFALVTEGIQRYASNAPGIVVRRWDFEKREQSMRNEAEAEELFPKTSSGNQRELSEKAEPFQAKEDERCLYDLRPTDPRHDKKRIEQTNGGLLRDLYRWILDNADFRQWREDQQSRLLWIKGDPGKGKTMLLCGIIDELQKPTAPTCLLSFFFCQATDSRINSATAVLRGLIYMLIDQQPSLISHVRKKYDRAGKSLFEDTNAWVALCEVLTNILQDTSLNTTYLIIDALDECVTDLSHLLNLVVQNTSISSHVNWMVSSRNWPEIEERLEMAGQKVRLCLELNTESISTAVSMYIDYKVRELAQLKKYDDRTESIVRDHLSSNANSTFLWVALVCRNLEEKGSRWKALRVVKMFPHGLDSLYERMMQKISTSDDADLLQWILASVTIVRRPLALNELMSFVDMREDIADDRESLRELIGRCGSFLTLQEHTAYFVHQSAKEFLLKNKYKEIFPAGVAKVHYTIFSKSLEVMTRTLHCDIYRLYAPGFPIDQVQQPDPDPLAAVGYSCIYWVEHLGEWDSTTKDRNGLDYYKAVYEFLKQRYLYWLEALSLLRGMAKGVLSIVKLDNFLKVRFIQSRSSIPLYEIP